MSKQQLEGGNASSASSSGTSPLRGGDLTAFLGTVQTRVLASADGIERTARRGDPVYQEMLRAGVAGSLRTAAAQLAQQTASLATPPR